MPKSAVIVNGENCSDVDFASDDNVNIVSVNELSCNKHLDNFVTKDPISVTYTYDFDHIYATNMNENNKNKTMQSEIRFLKELFLSNIDLVEQQTQLLETKDKQIAALQQENARLKLRLDRIGRRVKLQINQDVPEAQGVSNSVSHLNLSNNDTSVSSLNPVNISSFNMDSTVDSNGTANPSDAVSFTLTPSNGLARKRRTNDSTAESVCSVGSKRTVRSSSWNSSKDLKEESSEVCLDKLNGRMLKKESSRRRRRKKQIKNGDTTLIKKEENILYTRFHYYTPVGDDNNCFDIDEPQVNGCMLEVPSWRSRHFSSCYSMEGTEDLSEDVFDRRHTRLEIDERRRKKWDVQRIREQRQLERLRQREKKGESEDGESEELGSFWPYPDEVQYIQFTEMIPVSAFGNPIPNFSSIDFSIPWISLDGENLAARLRTLQMNRRKI